MALMQDKANRTKPQRKLDSQLIYAARQNKTKVAIPAVPRLQAMAKAGSDGFITVEIQGTITDKLRAAVAAASGRVLWVAARERRMIASLALNRLEELAACPDVIHIKPPARVSLNSGTPISEGAAAHQAIAARELYGATGAGIKVGLISDSVDDDMGTQAAVATSGLFNTNLLTVLPGQEGMRNRVEGLAMSKIIQDLAPEASIVFATGLGGMQRPDGSIVPGDSFADNIRALARSGCRVIVDDIASKAESPFQDNAIGQAIREVSDQGVLYFSAAGNDGNMDSKSSSIWEGDFLDGGPVSLDWGYEGEGIRIHAFAPGTNVNAVTRLTLEGVSLFWNDPMGASANDYDLFILTADGDVWFSSMNVQDGTQDPIEYFIGQVPTGMQIAIVRFGGDARILHLQNHGGRMKFKTPGAVRGHNACGAANAFCVAGAPASISPTPVFPPGPYPGSFNASNWVYLDSSDGPRRIFYEADGTPITPGNFSSTGGRVLNKPDFAAATGVTTGFAGLTSNADMFGTFWGTSCAAPHAAAIAALLLSYKTNLTGAEVRAALAASCVDVMSPGWDQSTGAGILMADRALQAVATVAVRPMITLQPFAQTIPTGESATFSLIASGPEPLSYRWLRNGSPVAGATNSSYTLAQAQPGDSGSQFSCQVSNVSGLCLSSNATLSVSSATVHNGGFETGGFEGWNQTDDDSIFSYRYSSRVLNTFGSIHSGGFGARLALPGTLTQTLPTVSGASYVISFWLSNPVSGGSNLFLVEWNGIPLFARTNLPAFDWTCIRLETQAAGPESTIKFTYGQSLNYFFLDGVSVQQALPPLAISVTPTNCAVISWMGSGYSLQENRSLDHQSWVNTTNAVVIPLGVPTNQVLVPATPDSMFYRLKL